MDSDNEMRSSRVTTKYDRGLTGFHYPFDPEELRPEDLIFCRFAGSHGKYNLIRYSPMGFEIIVKADELNTVKETSHCEIFFPGVAPIYYKMGYVGCIPIDQNNIKFIAAFRLYSNSSEERGLSDRRKARRWTCSEVFSPTAVAPNPLKFDDYIMFKVEDISKSGLRLITSPRNKLLHKGMILSLTINLPFSVNVVVNVEVVYMDATEEDGEVSVLLGAQFIKLDSQDLSAIAEYLMAIGSEASASDLKKEGFPVTKRALKADLKYVKTEEEYKEVLALRRSAYLQIGKVSTDVTPDYFRDVFDSRSRILISRRHGKITSSVRLTFHESFEQSELASDGVKKIDAITQIDSAEASRLCTLPEMKGADAAFELIAFLTLTAIKAGKRYIYGSAHGSMVEFYKRLGWTISDIEIAKTVWGEIKEKVVYVDVYEAVLGKNCSAAIWIRVYKDVYYFLSGQKRISPSFTESLRIRALEIISGGSE